jgi:hypothetical protein
MILYRMLIGAGAVLGVFFLLAVILKFLSIFTHLWIGILCVIALFYAFYLIGAAMHKWSE